MLEPVNVDTTLEGNQGDTSGSSILAPQQPGLLDENSDPFGGMRLPEVSRDDFRQALSQSNSPLDFGTGDFKALPASSKRQQALDYAKQFVDKVNYQWGGTTPAGFDCSGLVQYVWNKFGVSLPRVSSQQAGVGKQVALNQLQPMDLVGFSENNIGHIAFWLGNGYILEAPHSGAKVRIRKLGNDSFDRTAFGVHLNIS